MSKKALLITRAYYPSNASGAQRPVKLAKYLPAFGWTPVVLCAEWTPENAGDMYDPLLAAQPDVCRTVRIPYPTMPPTRIGRAPRRVAEILFPYRAPFGFTRRMLAAAEDLVRQEHFDVIWSTYTPGLTHHVASRIARRYGIPWVADFRDLPDQFVHYGWRDRRVLKAERRVCWGATVMTATTSWQAQRLTKSYGVPCHVVPNGFDPDDYPPVRGGPSEKFTIAYFGSLHTYRNPQVLFEALERLIAAGEVDRGAIRVLFYVTGEDLLKPWLAPYHNLQDNVEMYSRVCRDKMVRLMRESVVLLCLKSPEAGGSIPAKLFEYLGARRPILNVPGDGDLVDGVLDETRAGTSGSDPAEIADVLVTWYREWKATGTVAYRGIPEKIARYTRKEQAGQLARIFDSLTVGGPGGLGHGQQIGVERD